MTRENAKKQLIHILAFLNPQLSGADIKALNMAIDALEQEPNKSEIPTSCDDAISREAVLSVIDGWYEQNRDTENIEDLIILITYMSSVQPSKCEECGAKAREISKYSYEQGKKDSRRKGHWIDREEYDADRWECSECGRTEQYQENFCPNCGADMRESEEV